MSVLFDFFFSVAVVGGSVAALLFIGIKLVERARSQNRTYYPDEEYVRIALCETRHGIKTHYHKVGWDALNYQGYPIKGFPTLCGAEVGWDMQNQSVDATCETCNEAFENLVEQYGDNLVRA